MKRKKNKDRTTCDALRFAISITEGLEGAAASEDYREVCEYWERRASRLIKAGFIEKEGENKSLAGTTYTCRQWLKYKQCYRIERGLADDLFEMDDLSFPVDALKLPFPVIYLDMENAIPHQKDVDSGVPIGVFLLISEVPYGKNTIANLCSIVTLMRNDPNEESEFSFGHFGFDYYSEHMERTLEDTINSLAGAVPYANDVIRKAFLFAAYLSSGKPDVSENEVQKAFYRPSQKPKESAVRKWDVGVRYVAEKIAYKEHKSPAAAGTNALHMTTAGDGYDAVDDRTDVSVPVASSAVVNESRKPRSRPRSHIRKAHWHTYRIGKGRMERKILWIPPITVNVAAADGKKQMTDMPAVVHISKKVRPKKEMRGGQNIC